MPSSERNERGSFFQCLIIFLHFCAFLHWGLFCRSGRVDKTPPIFLFFCSDPRLTQRYFFLTLHLKIPPHLLINDWFHRSCSFLNILLFKILPQSCKVKKLFLRQLITTVLSCNYTFIICSCQYMMSTCFDP